MQKLGGQLNSLKHVVQDKINNMSTKLKHGTNLYNNSNNMKKDENNNNAASVEWHNFTLKELLEISQKNQWNDVHKNITSLILSLSEYNVTKPIQIVINDDNDDNDDDNDQKMDEDRDEDQDDEDEKEQNQKNAENKENEENEEKELTGNEALKMISYLRTEFECDICLDSYIEPLTLGCGHTFCRLCIIQIHSKCDKKCPLCKAVCPHIDPYSHSQNVTMNNCVKRIISPSKYNQRMLQLNKEKENLGKNIPVFTLNMVRYPGMKLQLHLFEPRYLHMINRAISSGNKFAYLCKTMNNNHNNGYHPVINDIACLIRIQECQFLPDGRCLMQGICSKRIIVTSTWIEKGTQGLWYVKYDNYDDNNNNNDNDNDCNTINQEYVNVINKFVDHYYNGPTQIIQAIESECGQRIILNNTNIEKWSFWICSLIYIIIGKNLNGVSLSWIKQQLQTKNTLQRIESCYDILKSPSHEWNK